MSRPRLRVTLLRSLVNRSETMLSSYFAMSSIWQVFTSHLSIKSSSKIFQYQLGGKQKEQDYKLAELLLYLKTTTYTNLFIIFIAQIYAFLNKIIYQKNTNKRFPYIHSRTSNSHSRRISVPPFQKQPFADVLQSRCSFEYYEILQPFFSQNTSGGCFCPLPSVPLKIILWWLLLPFASTFRNSY